MKIKLFSKKALSALLACSMVLSTGVISAGAANGSCITYSGSNINAQNYNSYYSHNAADVIKSYLTETASGELMRFQSFDRYTYSTHHGDDYLVEYYDKDYNIIRTKTIAVELPKFGGFYATDTNYYILSGQDNLSESADVECYRITKYDLNWNRISSTGLYNCNTYEPFDAGSARFDVCGKYLLIRTCHTMYQASDGRHHQANVTIEVDTDSMQITDSFTKVWNISGGYISHSFNQFIKLENNKIVAVDHGDAYPRSIVLTKYGRDVTGGTFSGSVSAYNLISFPGSIGANYTGATVGGFEISSTSYLTAGNCVAIDDNYTSNSTRNIYVTVTDKSTNNTTVNYITNFAEGSTSTTCPHLTKVSDTDFLLTWTQGSDLYYTMIDENGQTESDIKKFEGGQISDCDPIIVDGKAVWYTWNNSVNSFYEIDLNTLKCTKNVTENGHKYVFNKFENGSAYLTCSVCGTETTQLEPTSISTWWNTTGRYSSYSSRAISSGSYGTIGYLWVQYSPSNAVNDIEITSSNESVVTITPYNSEMFDLNFVGNGTATITISSKYNPNLIKTYNITVTGGPEITTTVQPTTTVPPTTKPQPTTVPTTVPPTTKPQPTTIPTTVPVTTKPQPTTVPAVKKVYYKNSNNWQNVTAYYWSDSNMSMTTWPGSQMKNEGNGIYSIEVSADTQYIIFSNNGSGQTPDLTIPANNMIYNNGNWTEYVIETTVLTTTTTPVTQPTTVDTSYLIGDANLNGRIAIDDVTLIQKYLVELVTLSEKAVLASDTDLDGNVNVKDATNIQKYIAKLPTNSHIGENVQPATEPATTQESTTVPPTTQAPASRKLYYKNTNNFNTVYAYYWSDTNYNLTKWPGVEMTSVGNNIYSIEVPSEAEYIIFNYNSYQTADLKIEKFGMIYDNGSWQTYEQPTTDGCTEPTYEPIPSEPESTTKVYFMNTKNWSNVYAYYWNDSNMQMTVWPGEKMQYDGDDIYRIKVPSNAKYIIFNNGSGTQTADLDIQSSGMAYKDGEWVPYTSLIQGSTSHCIIDW